MHPLIGLRAKHREYPEVAGIIVNVPTSYLIDREMARLPIGILTDSNTLLAADFPDLILDDPAALRVRIARLTGTL
tara:strand:+ start:100 stop:327 length:228 start_codon:yes stop_codon:yes gene_type:complete